MFHRQHYKDKIIQLLHLGIQVSHQPRGTNRSLCHDYRFILIKNSLLSLVFCMYFKKVFMASSEFISAR